MAYCTYCGNQNRRGAGFCRYCGQPMDIIEDAPEVSASITETINGSPQLTNMSIEPEMQVEALHVEPDTTGVNLEENASESSASLAPAMDEMPDAAAGTVSVDGESDASMTEEDQVIPLPSDLLSEEPQDTFLSETPLETEQAIAHTPTPIVDEDEEDRVDEVEPPQTTQIQVDDSPQSVSDFPLTGAVFPALIALEPGAILRERYHILAELARSEDRMEYDAEDWRRCWVCQATQSDPEAKFCEMCGAQLEEKPHVRIIASHLTSAADADERGIDDFEEGNTYYQVIVNQSAEQVGAETAPRLRYISGFQLHPGMIRGNNEDSLLVLELNVLSEVKDFAGLGCYAVADGIGGYSAGEVASGAAVRVLSAQIMSEIFTPIISGEALDRETVKQCLQNAILKANQEILDLRQQQSEHSDMGCTLTLALIQGSEATVANVGDSRTYRMRQGKLEPISQDHSIVARLVEQGMIKPQEVYTHEQRNVIYRTIGDLSELQIDMFDVDLESGDRLLLCSDGLWEMVHDPNMEDVLLENYDAQQACNRLVDLANQAGGLDNISVIVINVQS